MRTTFWRWVMVAGLVLGPAAAVSAWQAASGDCGCGDACPRSGGPCACGDHCPCGH